MYWLNFNAVGWNIELYVFFLSDTNANQVICIEY